MAQSNPPKAVSELSDEERKWLHVAEPEFHHRHLDLANYKVTVQEEKESVTVILTSSDAPQGGRGSMGKHPGYEVEINRKDLKIIRSHYVR